MPLMWPLCYTPLCGTEGLLISDAQNDTWCLQSPADKLLEPIKLIFVSLSRGLQPILLPYAPVLLAQFALYVVGRSALQGGQVLCSLMQVGRLEEQGLEVDLVWNGPPSPNSQLVAEDDVA